MWTWSATPSPTLSAKHTNRKKAVPNEYKYHQPSSDRIKSIENPKRLLLLLPPDAARCWPNAKNSAPRFLSELFGSFHTHSHRAFYRFFAPLSPATFYCQQIYIYQHVYVCLSGIRLSFSFSASRGAHHKPRLSGGRCWMVHTNERPYSGSSMLVLADAHRATRTHTNMQKQSNAHRRCRLNIGSA